MTANDITRFVNSRAMVAIAGVIMLAAARYAFQTGEVTYITGDRGILFASANQWVDNPWLSMVFNTALTLAIGLVWMLIIQVFNPFRALSTLETSFFLIMMTSTPDLLDQIYSGTLLGAAVMIGLALLWTTYADSGRMRHIFLLFTLLSALTMTQYCFAVYIPVFVLGCVQMKIFSLRSIIACLLGIITPWWIALGSGLVTPDAIHTPSFDNFFTAFDFDDALHIVLVAVTTAVLLIVAWCANFMKVLTLNANLRAFNGSISLVGLVTLLAMAADFTNAAAYLPTLYLITSYQLAYMFASHAGTRRYVPILTILAVYLALFVLRMSI